ncbi:MAG TPA: hypothetical protein VMJ10_33740 [Kofleriaceae bacterium]|nr:hypothetical protein [Kofleriaceae bacterium]
MKYAVLVVALFACGKKSEDAAADKKTSESSSSPSAAAGGALKWMAIDPLGIEVEMPACGQIAFSDNNSANVIAANTDHCGKAALTFNNLTKLQSFDEELKILTGDVSPEFSRKDKTADGWIFELKMKESGDTLPHLRVEALFKNISCSADTMDAAEAATNAHACASMRAKR